MIVSILYNAGKLQWFFRTINTHNILYSLVHMFKCTQVENSHANNRKHSAPVQNNNAGALALLVNRFLPLSLSLPTFIIGCPGSAFTMETYMVLVFLMGSGRERNMKGSNIFDNPLQWGQTSVDLSWPWNSRTTTL